MKNKLTLGLIALAICVAPVGVSAQEKKKGPRFPKDVMQLVAKTKKQIKSVDLESFKKIHDRKAYQLLVDVRSEKEYKAGHIPGAVNVDRGFLEFGIWKHVGFPANTNRKIKMYVYCRGGMMSTLATKTLQDLGFTDVTQVNMRVRDWAAKGYPLAK